MDADRVELVPSRPVEWAQRFNTMATDLRAILGDDVSIEHIGSTAVPGLAAKDVVDVLIGVAPAQVPTVRDRLVRHGLILEGQQEGHAWLARRESGRRVCVIHIIEAGSERWTRRIAFRDLLRTDADARSDYLRVKQQAEAATTNWNDYTQAKTATVHRLLCQRPD